MQARALRVPEVCVHISVPTYIAACFCISLWCLRLSISVLRWKSIKMCGRLLAPLSGITLTTLHSSQQFHDDTVSTSVHPLVSTQETNGTTSSGSAFGPQLPHGPISSPVLAGPTRNVTGEAMPTSLAEAVTPLSFLKFLQRCGLLIAPPQPPQLPVPISLLHAAVQTTPPCDASQDVSTQTSDLPVSRYLLTWQCRRLSTVSTPHLWTLPCRRSHTVLCLSTFLRRCVLA